MKCVLKHFGGKKELKTGYSLRLKYLELEIRCKEEGSKYPENSSASFRVWLPRTQKWCLFSGRAWVMLKTRK